MTRRTRFVHIDPKEQVFKVVYGENPEDVYPPSLARGVDHGWLARGLAIIVWQHGLLESDGPYFVQNGQLFSGDAIVYAYDGTGETVDVPPDFGPTGTLWLRNRRAVELAISSGVIRRPCVTVDGKVTWEWNR